MSSEGPEEIKQTFKADGTAGGDQGLLNLLTDDTVFYVGGYPSTFKVRAQTTECFCCGDGLSHPERIRWCWVDTEQNTKQTQAVGSVQM